MEHVNVHKKTHPFYSFNALRRASWFPLNNVGSIKKYAFEKKKLKFIAMGEGTGKRYVVKNKDAKDFINWYKTYGRK